MIICGDLNWVYKTLGLADPIHHSWIYCNDFMPRDIFLTGRAADCLHQRRVNRDSRKLLRPLKQQTPFRKWVNKLNYNSKLTLLALRLLLKILSLYLIG
jgi:hypothetical protein